MQAGAGHPSSTHIAFNCNVGTLFGLKESKCIEIHISSIPRVTMLIGVRGVAGGPRMEAGAGHLLAPILI